MDYTLVVILCYLTCVIGIVNASKILQGANLDESDEDGKDNFGERLDGLERDYADIKNQMEKMLAKLATIHESIVTETPVRDTRAKRDILPGSSGQDTLGGNDSSMPTGTTDEACASGSLNCPYAMSSDCIVCPTGPQGPQGVTGPTGLPGRDGRDGRDGTPGSRGDKGDTATLADAMPTSGPSVNQAAPPNFDRLLEVIAQNNGSGGVTYVRWGRSNCPHGAEKVYEGYTAGGSRDLKGGGSNYLCLPTNPIYSYPNAGSDSASRVYGVEYEVDDFPRLHDQGIDDMEALCVVCLAPLRSAVLVVPGRNDCLSETPERNWHLEYSGYLMSASYRYYRTEYICVDAFPEFRPGSNSNINHATIYVVESRCSDTPTEGFPCPPYVDGYELTCAVCTA